MGSYDSYTNARRRLAGVLFSGLGTFDLEADLLAYSELDSIAADLCMAAEVFGIPAEELWLLESRQQVIERYEVLRIRLRAGEQQSVQ